MDFFNGRYTPRKLDVLLRGLPRTSHYSAAKASDDEIAEAIEAAGELDTRHKDKPPLQDFTRELEVLQGIYHRLGDVGSVLARSKRKLDTLPTPETAVDRLRRRRAREAAEHVESMLIYPDGRKVT